MRSGTLRKAAISLSGAAMLGALAVTTPAAAASDTQKVDRLSLSSAASPQWNYSTSFLSRGSCDKAANLIKDTTGYPGQCRGPMNSGGRFDLYLWY